MIDRPRRPYFNKVIPHTWTNPGQPDTPGIAFIGLGGYSAHLTPAEALELSDHIVDIAEAMQAANPEGPTP